MILIANKGEIFAKGHYKLFDILNNLLFNNSFIYILNIPFADFFGVDKLQHIRIFEHHNRLAG